ncbi:MAG: hypothetical protein ABS68_06090 [Niastella sp. SCN 39-18]|nr:thioesterase family protein [Sphingobacteriales bacterium]ODT53299.1 MAG: hypothetical protein ABS68_06090 [Niastella sp. SCN 39-18]OJW08565.1 MAG: hypothetical protein BGO53_10050 [Sphingobacteriales bacterium 39-19]
MARIKIKVPEDFKFEVSLPVRITDLNYGNHVGNDALIALLHEARVQWLAMGGFSELNVGGPGIIMAAIAVQYKAEIFYGDILKIKIAVGEISNSGFQLYYMVTNKSQQEVAKAISDFGCFDHGQHKIALVPEGFIRFLQE